MKPYFQDNAVTIWHGDCREILPTLPKVDLVLNKGLSSSTNNATLGHEQNRQAGKPGLDKTQSGNPVALSGAENVSGANSRSVSDMPARNGKDSEASRNHQQGERSDGQREWPIQGRLSKHALPPDDCEGQMREMRLDGTTSDSSQEFHSHGQSSQQPSDSLLAMPQQSAQAGMVATGKILLLTDPPYGIGRDHQRLTTGGNGGRKAHAQLGEWDSQRPTKDTFDLMLSRADVAIIWGGKYFADLLPASSKWLVWNKEQRINQSDGELAWTSMVGALRICDMNRVELLIDGTQHPTQKPIKLMTWCLSFASDAQTILDPFMGSGTTLRAAKDLGRRAIGIELEEKYCEMAARRMQQEVLAL